MTDECNGWKNYETWNVALHIGNDEGLYDLARRFRVKGYSAFVAYLAAEFDGHQFAIETADGVKWNDESLDIEALDEMMGDL